MSPKKLLKFKDAGSNLEDFGEGLRFKRVLPDTTKLENDKVKKVIFCSGQVYYDIDAARKKE
jgi:2-oxoglutarate dehydrogenase E1 component